jgi:hypothetical protein
MILLGRLISLDFVPGRWEVLRCHRNFAVGRHDDTAEAGEIAIELDRPSPSQISSVVLLPICIDLLVGGTEGLVLGLIEEQAESQMATYRRLGIFTCSVDVLYDRDFFSRAHENHLKAHIERSLTLALQIRLV